MELVQLVDFQPANLQPSVHLKLEACLKIMQQQQQKVRIVTDNLLIMMRATSSSIYSNMSPLNSTNRSMAARLMLRDSTLGKHLNCGTGNNQA